MQGSCKIFYTLKEKLCCKICKLCARFARYVQDLVEDLVRRILTRFAYFLQDDFYWVVLQCRSVLDGS